VKFLTLTLVVAAILTPPATLGVLAEPYRGVSLSYRDISSQTTIAFFYNISDQPEEATTAETHRKNKPKTCSEP
jgi:hypothetical protein